VKVKVQGMTLRRGRHTLGIGDVVKDLGQANFTIGDNVR
jgi:hypothetical protein